MKTSTSTDAKPEREQAEVVRRGLVGEGLAEYAEDLRLSDLLDLPPGTWASHDGCLYRRSGVAPHPHKMRVATVMKASLGEPDHAAERLKRRREGLGRVVVGMVEDAEKIANGYMRTLSAGYGLAKEKWGLVTGLTFPIEPDGKRGLYMPPDVFAAISEQLPTQDMRDVFELAYLNGIRQGQLRKTEIGNVIIKRVNAKEHWEITWRGDQTKAGKRDGQPHTLALVGRSLEIVRQAYMANRREHCPCLWHGIKCGRWSRRHRAGDPCLGRMQAEWKKACAAAGVPCGRKNGGYVFHHTRNSAVTNFSGADIPDTVATTITGHRTLAVYKRYGIRRESVQRAAMEKVEAYVRGLSATDRAARNAG